MGARRGSLAGLGPPPVGSDSHRQADGIETELNHRTPSTSQRSAQWLGVGKIPTHLVPEVLWERKGEAGHLSLIRDSLTFRRNAFIYLQGLGKAKKALEKGNFKIGPDAVSTWQGPGFSLSHVWRSLPGCEDGSPRVSRSAPFGPQRLALTISQLSVSPVTLRQLFIIARNRGTSSGSSGSSGTSAKATELQCGKSHVAQGSSFPPAPRMPPASSLPNPA